MKIYLLTHKRELARQTNTGLVVLSCLGEIVERVVWDRVNPDLRLVEHIEQGEVALMYPDKNAECSNIDSVDNIIVIDATWQEANKIYNKSPYLKSIARVSLDVQYNSSYHLRRNQPLGGLCTAETIIEFLRQKGNISLAKTLEVNYEKFIDI